VANRLVGGTKKQKGKKTDLQAKQYLFVPSMVKRGSRERLKHRCLWWGESSSAVIKKLDKEKKELQKTYCWVKVPFKGRNAGVEEV